MKPAVALTARDWNVVNAMARDLARDVDRNELGKVVTYLRRTRSREKFLQLLDRLPQSVYIRRSNRTQTYFRRIAKTCRSHLANVSDEKALALVGWAFRLMTYYQAEQEKTP